MDVIEHYSSGFVDGVWILRTEVINFIDKIYDNFEAQLKAKESDLERQDMIIKCLSMDLDSKEKLLKAKDEEIKVLECRAYHAEGYISDLHNNPKDKKFYDKKARSIVAMLFWEWKKQCENRGKYNDHHNFAREQKRSEAYYKFLQKLQNNKRICRQNE